MTQFKEENFHQDWNGIMINDDNENEIQTEKIKMIFYEFKESRNLGWNVKVQLK